MVCSSALGLGNKFALYKNSLENLGAVQNFQGVNFQFGLKINATYSGEHSDIASLEL